MVFENVLSFIPLTVGGIIGQLVTTLIIFLALIIADKIIAHDMEAKHILIMSFLVAFVVPIATSVIISLTAGLIPAIIGGIFVAGLPLLFWIVLGEVLLGGDYKQKILVAFIAWAIYFVLLMFNIGGMIMQFIPL